MVKQIDEVRLVSWGPVADPPHPSWAIEVDPLGPPTEAEVQAGRELVAKLAVDITGFNRAAALAGAQLKLFGLLLGGADGKRRHGQIKHIRDLRRQFAKIEARRG